MYRLGKAAYSQGYPGFESLSLRHFLKQPNRPDFSIPECLEDHRVPAGNLMIVQGGGPTAVFNTSLAAILTEAQHQPRIGHIYGARFGMQGLPHADILDLTHLSPGDLLAIRNSPGASLGSSRFKPEEQDLARSIDHLRRLDIRFLIFMGGNGTMRGAQLVGDFCRKLDFDIQIIGVPKTIDNDIAATDRCPGFASAARFIAQSTLDLAMDIRSLPQPVSIFETLGRDVGWLAASSTLARHHPDDAPHLVYVPEIPFSRDTFLSNLDAIVTRLGWAVVVVSEGTAYADGTPVFEQQIASGKQQPNRPLIGGVAQHLSGVVAQALSIRCRSEKPGLIGRSSMAHVSAQDQADAELVGREAVRALAAGETDQMVALRSLSDQAAPASELVPLHAAASARRPIPTAWLTDGPLAVTDAFRDYARPILGSLNVYPPPLSARP
jgi:6-phosphofructokinase